MSKIEELKIRLAQKKQNVEDIALSKIVRLVDEYYITEFEIKINNILERVIQQQTRLTYMQEQVAFN